MRRSVLGAVVLVGMAAVAVAETVSPTVRLVTPDGVERDVPVISAAGGAEPEGTFGTGHFYTWLGIGDFRPVDSATGVAYQPADGYFYAASGAGPLVAALQLPAGARLDEVRLYYYDADEISGLTLSVCRNRSEGTGPVTNVAFECPWSATNVTAEMPNYATMSVSPLETIRYRSDVGGAPGVADDVDWSVWVQFNGLRTQWNRIRGVRLYWKLQISPAPAVATFSDVPAGHSAFQAVEALAASGVTAGCATGQFCPDNPVTRAQMALFLSRALGLAWPY